MNGEEPVRSIVGGVDYSVGGWSQYEIDRRMYQRAHGGGKSHYSTKSITVRDAIHSIAAQRNTRGALHNAAMRLADSLGGLEDKICEADESGMWECLSANSMRAKVHELDGVETLTVPPLTSSDLRAFATDIEQKTDPHTLHEIGRSVAVLSDIVGVPMADMPEPRFKQLSTRIVPITDDDAVAKIEAKAGKSLKGIEELQAKLASNMDIASRAINGIIDRVQGGSSKAKHNPEKTRGDEIDTAAAMVPKHFLDNALPFTGDHYFDYDYATNDVTVTSDNGGLYFGQTSLRDSPARNTHLTPKNVVITAYMTSGRRFAWCIVNSPEANYLIRSLPTHDGKVVRVDENAVKQWIGEHITGSPPHKVKLSEYVKYLRTQGLEVHVGSVRFKEVRFRLADILREDEKEKMLHRLRIIKDYEFEKMDWSEYDRKVVNCENVFEIAGDVIIEDNKLKVPKVRTGLVWGVFTHNRSFITFHTHPAIRYQGSKPEAPSEADIVITLEECANDMLAWAFITAPEGTYIIRPTKMLIMEYHSDKQKTLKMISDFYYGALNLCRDSAKYCTLHTQNTLRECGFICYFHSNPCLKVNDKPDLFPALNSKSREWQTRVYNELMAMSPQDIAALDWSQIDSHRSPIIQDITWIGAHVVNRTVQIYEGHIMNDIESTESYPFARVPLFILHFPACSEMPASVPHAFTEVARMNTGTWAWCVMICDKKMVVFRVIGDNVEIHEPITRTGRSKARKTHKTR